MAVKLYQKLKQDLTQLAAWVRGQYAKKDEVKIFVGTCGTAAGTAAKVVSVDAFPTVSSGGATLPVTGTVIAVKFSNTNTAGSPTLNVNGTGAASIWYGSAVYGTGTPTVAGSAGQYTFFVWNGTYWVWQGQGIASSGGGGVQQVQSNHSQNDPTAVDYIKNRTHYVAQAAYSAVWSQTGVEVGSGTSSPGAYSGTFTLTSGQSYRVVITGGGKTVTYLDIVAEPYNNGMLLRRNWADITGSPSAQNDAFYILVQASSIMLASVDVFGTGCTVEVSNSTEVVVQLPEKFIPATIARVSDVDDKAIVYPVVVETQATGTYTLPPNTFVKFGTIESISFSLDAASEVSGHVNEYVVQFDTYHTSPTVGFPSTVIFPATLTLEADMTYQISIVNNLALVQSWPNS